MCGKEGKVIKLATENSEVNKNTNSFVIKLLVTCCLLLVIGAGNVFGAPTFTISGYVQTSGGAEVEGVNVAGDNGAGSAVTAADGAYSITVPNHWSGTITVNKSGWLITPASKIYNRVHADIANENYTAYQPKISGYVKKTDSTVLSGATVSASGGATTTTNTSGYYEIVVPYGWSGNITATLTGYYFTAKNYTNVTTDQANQDFSGYQPTISGVITSYGVALEGVTLTASNGGGTAITNSSGNYNLTISYGWSGTITPSKPQYTFTPANKIYSNITADTASQNYTAILPPVSISGVVRNESNSVVTGVTITADNGGGSGFTDANGFYTIVVPYRWSGRIIPTKPGYALNPPFRNYNDVREEIDDQDYVAYAHLYGGGSGIQGDPYLIVSSSQFQTLRNRSQDWDKHFKLLTDVTVPSGFIIASDENPNNGGYDGKGFTGVLDGGGHSVGGVSFNFTISGKYYYGLFGCIGEQGIVKNLTVKNASIRSSTNYTGVFAPLAALNYGQVDNCRGTGTVKGSGSCAGLVAINYGMVMNSSADCILQGLGVDSGTLGGLVAENRGIITDSFVNTSVSQARLHLGGLVGNNFKGSIYRCGATGSVTGVRGIYYGEDPLRIGGLVGTNYEGRIEKSYANVSVTADNSAEWIGGFAGDNVRAEIFSSYSTGTVSVGTNSRRIGGLVGMDYDGGITNCYTVSHVNAVNATEIGGLVGSYDGYRTMVYLSYWDIEACGINYSDGGIGLTTAQMKDINTYHGWGDDTWTIDNGNDYPNLIIQNQPGIQIIDAPRNYAGGVGTAENPYLIANAQQLNIISSYPGDWCKHFELVNDINLAEISGEFIPLGYGSGFSGVFDGKGYSIKNLIIDVNQSANEGLFTLISSDGEVKNIDVDTFHIDIGLPEYGGIAGSIAATNKGVVRNCQSKGSIKASYYAGGLIGVNYGDIFECVFSGNVTCGSFGGGLVGYNVGGSIFDSESVADIENPEGAWCLGGLTGYNQEVSVSYCRSKGTLTVGEGSQRVGGLTGFNNDSLVSNCYSTVSIVTGPNSTKIGGFAGDNSFQTISNSWSSGIVSAGDNSSYVGGLVGYNYAKISNCYSKSNVWGTTNVGGLVGYSQGSDYVEGGWLIEYSYCAGQVTGDANVGGLIGAISDSNVVSSFWDVNSCRIGISAGGVGLSTTQMMFKNTFSHAGWDFTNETTNGTGDFWRMCVNGVDYPRLAWEVAPADFVCPEGVNFIDFAFFAERWLNTDCQSSNDCEGADIDKSGKVDMGDLLEFASWWMEGM